MNNCSSEISQDGRFQGEMTFNDAGKLICKVNLGIVNNNM